MTQKFDPTLGPGSVHRDRRFLLILTLVLFAGILLLIAFNARRGRSPADAPLTDNGRGGRRCVADPTEKPRLVTFPALDNGSGLPIIVDRIRQRDAHNLRLVDSSLVQIAANRLESGVDYPPTAAQIPTGVDWLRRQQIKGAVLKPTMALPPNASYQIALALQPDRGTTGTADGVEIAYHTD